MNSGVGKIPNQEAPKKGDTTAFGWWPQTTADNTTTAQNLIYIYTYVSKHRHRSRFQNPFGGSWMGGSFEEVLSS